MTDLFDQQITEGLRRTADDVGVPSGSFGDVRRRVRARRRRHLAAVAVPAVAGLAWVGLRPTVQPAPLSLGSPTAPTAPPPSTVATDTETAPTAPPPATVATDTETAPTAPPPSTMPTSTSIGSVSTLPGSVSTLPSDLVNGVLCVDMTGHPDGAAPGCQEYLPSARATVVPARFLVEGPPSFVVALDRAHDAEAQNLGAVLDLPVRPELITAVLDELVGVDLGSVRVVMVIASAVDTTDCTLPDCLVPTTAAPPDLLADDTITGVEALFVALGFPGDRYPTLQGGVTQIVSADPERPAERRVVLTVRPGTPDVTPTTVGVGSDAERVVVIAEASDGRTYELEIIDVTGRNLPSSDEALGLLTGIVP